MEWRGDSLVVHITEVCSPLPFPLRGTIKLHPAQMYAAPIVLDSPARHRWQAVAPLARIEVDMQSPCMKWSGTAYHDMNWGSVPLESSFRGWSWLRTHTEHGTTVFYDVTERDGTQRTFGRNFKNGAVSEQHVPQLQALPRGFWGMPRSINSEAKPKLLETLEDAPFYTRNRASITYDNRICEAVHESLSLDRFTNPIVQMMLPFRMPRRA